MLIIAPAWTLRLPIFRKSLAMPSRLSAIAWDLVQAAGDANEQGRELKLYDTFIDPDSVLLPRPFAVKKFGLWWRWPEATAFLAWEFRQHALAIIDGAREESNARAHSSGPQYRDTISP